MNRWLVGLAASLAVVGGLALAQVPGLFITSPNGNEQINVLTTTPSIATVKLTQIRDASGYMAQQVPLTGFSITVASNASMLTLKPAGTLSTGTITFPAAPADGLRVQIYSTQTVTTLTLSGNAGQTVDSAVTTLTANVAVEYFYSLATTTWYRIQ